MTSFGLCILSNSIYTSSLASLATTTFDTDTTYDTISTRLPISISLIWTASIEASTIAMPKLTLGTDQKQLIQSFSWKKGGMCDVDNLYKAHKDLRQYNGNSIAATLCHANKKSEKGEMPEMVTASKEAKRMAATAESIPEDLSARIRKKGRVGKTLVTLNDSSASSIAQEEGVSSLRATIEGEELLYMPNKRHGNLCIT